MPEVQDLARETEATHKLYGIDDPVTENFGRQCLMARRFLERGVRFVQVTHSDSEVQWDQHSNLYQGHTKNAAEVDKPIAGLLTDLKTRGLLDDTLVLWGGEFGRTPTAEGTDGRDHNPHGFTMWMAGGGVKARHGLRRDRRLRLLRRREQDAHPRPARHDSAPAGPGPREADIPLRRPRLPADRCRWSRGHGDIGVKRAVCFAFNTAKARDMKGAWNLWRPTN